jgi:hypothetical protein
VDFASYCGGSLGLFLGFSVLSAVEIVYYFSLRILCFKKQKTKVGSIQIEGENKQKSYLLEAVGSSSIHGCNQIAINNRHIFERIFWTIVVGSALVFCCRPTYTLFVKYQKSNIMMKYENVLDSSEKVRNSRILVTDCCFLPVYSDHVSSNHNQQSTAKRLVEKLSTFVSIS